MALKFLFDRIQPLMQLFFDELIRRHREWCLWSVFLRFGHVTFLWTPIEQMPLSLQSPSVWPPKAQLRGLCRLLYHLYVQLSPSIAISQQYLRVSALVPRWPSLPSTLPPCSGRMAFCLSASCIQYATLLGRRTAAIPLTLDRLKQNESLQAGYNAGVVSADAAS